MKTRILFIVLICSFLTVNSQNIPIGEWRTHLPYNKAIGVKVAGDEVYCLTSKSLFTYDRKTGLLETISKIDGLSGNAFSALGYNESQKCIIIGYEDGAIDLIKNNEIVNVVDVKNSEVGGGVKRINRIVCYNKYAYLCGEFGIVVYDLDREEVKDTYRMRMDGVYVNVWAFTADDKNFYAATDEGIFSVAKNSPYIFIDTSWHQMETPEYGKCVAINYWKGKLVYYFETTKNVYTQTPLKNDHALLNNVNNLPSPSKLDLSVSNNQLLLSADKTLYIYSDSYQSPKIIKEVHVGDTTQRISPMQAFYAGNNQYFVADYNLGLLNINDMERIAGEVIQPNGPYSHRSFNMTTDGKKVWVASGGHGDFWAPVWKYDGLYCFDGYSWSSFNNKYKNFPDPIRDVSNITIHPQNKDLLYIGTWGTGIVKIKNGVVDTIFNDSNSPLQKRCGNSIVQSQGEFIAGIAFDSKGLMWVANSNAENLLLTLDKSGTWATHYLGNNYSCREIRTLMIDSYDNKWLVDRLGTLIVYHEKNGGVVREIGSAAGLEGLAYSIIEDKNQNIWVGTKDGIYVIRNIYSVLEKNNGSFYPVNIERPKLVLGGHVDYLLVGETIVKIVVNGANEKWCLSSKQGVYQITSDGTGEIVHFTAEKTPTTNRTPLLSDNMIAACITDNGEVFFATEQGIVSYRDEVTKGTSSNNNVYAFPNPVKPDYQGPIAISGVVDMADIKITDVAGNLVYSTKAKGGQAIWYAKDFNGKRVKAGVYIVFITNEDGTETTTTKIMVLN